ncbi:MAG: nucleoid-associated protein, partial [Cyclobacteriaceae bacterium]
MIDSNVASIDHITFHKISVEPERSSLNESDYDIDAEEEELLLNIFLKPFESVSETYEFKHDIDKDMNVLFKLSESIHQESKDFMSLSNDIHTHLQSVSKHPNIKDGDLFIVKYTGVTMNNDHCEALGIYKVENKQAFVETTGDDRLNFRKGISTKKLDKS